MPVNEKSGNDPRRLARRAALQFLHQLEVQGQAGLKYLEIFLEEFCEDVRARDLARSFISGTWKDRKEIDRRIEQVSSNWELGRINQIDRVNLRLAVFQLLSCPEIPAKVVINEAVELAKIFSTTQAPSFVNGILDTIRKNIIG